MTITVHIWKPLIAAAAVAACGTSSIAVADQVRIDTSEAQGILALFRAQPGCQLTLDDVEASGYDVELGQLIMWHASKIAGAKYDFENGRAVLNPDACTGKFDERLILRLAPSELSRELVAETIASFGCKITLANAAEWRDAANLHIQAAHGFDPAGIEANRAELNRIRDFGLADLSRSGALVTNVSEGADELVDCVPA